MNKKTTSAGLVLAAVFLWGIAAQARGPKIGYISISRVFESTSEGRAILARLQGEHSQKQKDLDKRMKDFEKKAKQFQQQAAMLKEEVRQARIKVLAKEERELQMRFMQYQQEINRKKQEALGKFEQQVMGVVHAIAKREGLDYILRQEVLLHGPPGMDYTNQVIREYDKRHPGDVAKKKNKKKKKKKGN